ncbi:MAG: hypothetical protein Kilf2KO_34230 [Rhodospirillales bacterium]
MPDEKDRAPLIDAEKVTITEGNPETDLGLGGTVNAYPGYSFTGKIFDVGSEFGLENGRISKLTVAKEGEAQFSYQRGWPENEPAFTDEQTTVLREIVDAFPDPKDPSPAPRVAALQSRERKGGRRR